METRAARRARRQAEAFINETRDHMFSTTNHEGRTSPGTTTSTATTRQGGHDSSGCMAMNQQPNSHPAWNQDSRARRAAGSGR